MEDMFGLPFAQHRHESSAVVQFFTAQGRELRAAPLDVARQVRSNEAASARDQHARHAKYRYSASPAAVQTGSGTSGSVSASVMRARVPPTSSRRGSDHPG